VQASAAVAPLAINADSRINDFGDGLNFTWKWARVGDELRKSNVDDKRPRFAQEVT
jgi:hypothetical protein